MKPVRTLYLLLSLALSVFSCTEIGPVIAPLQEEDGVSSGNTVRRVLVEEFSGVRCVNCPAGSTELTELAKRYPDQLVILSIHAGFFSNPYMENLYDFRTPEGNSLLNLLGQPLGYPSAVINRKKFEGETDLQLSRAQWAGFIAEELQKAPDMGIQIQTNYDRSSRALRADIDIERLNSLNYDPTELRLSVFLIENDIRDVQLTPEGKVTAYPHQHVLRKALTPYDGSPIGSDLVTRTGTRRGYTATLPLHWNAASCKIIAFVHRSSSNQEVLQATEHYFY